MSVQNHLAQEYNEMLDQLNGSMDRLETILAHVLQVLEQHGVKFSVDVRGLVRAVRRDLDTVQGGSQRLLSQLTQFQGLVHTSAVLTSFLDLDQVLQEVIDTVIALTGAERAYLMLRDAQTGTLCIRAARNWDRETLSDSDVMFSQGVVERAIETQEPVISNNAQHDARFQTLDSVLKYGLRSIFCIPLVLRGEVAGALYADNRIAQGLFSPDSLPLLTAFANQAMIAIENARLFEQVRAELDHAQQEVQRLRTSMGPDSDEGS